MPSRIRRKKNRQKAGKADPKAGLNKVDHSGATAQGRQVKKGMAHQKQQQ